MSILKSDKGVITVSKSVRSEKVGHDHKLAAPMIIPLAGDSDETKKRLSEIADFIATAGGINHCKDKIKEWQQEIHGLRYADWKASQP
jgi:hypothetical protein